MHGHNPNPSPPSDDPTLRLITPDGVQTVTLDRLRRLPVIELPPGIIHSTGHPASGPFVFAGVALGALIAALAPGEWSAAEVVSADGFGTRVARAEWAEGERPILLAHRRDGLPLTRREGLVRLIVPSETDEALRQVKWLSEIRLFNL